MNMSENNIIEAEVITEPKMKFGTVSVNEIVNPFDPLKDMKKSVTLDGRPLKEYFKQDQSYDLVVCLNGEIVEDYDLIVPQNSSIIVSPYVAGGGGGKNIFRMIAMVALVVVAPYAGAYLGGAVAGGFAGFGGAYAAIGTAVVAIGGSMLINAVLPPEMPSDLGGSGLQESPTYSWNGIKTSTTINAPIPVVYGKAWIGGTVINRYVTYDGEDEWLHVQLALCHGEIYKIDEGDIFINGNPFSVYASQTLDEGTDDERIQRTAILDQRSGAFNQTVMDDFGDSSFIKTVNLPVTVAGGAKTIRTDSTNINKLTVHVAFAQGLCEIENNGDLKSHTVKYTIEFRKVGDANWTTFQNANDDLLDSSLLYKASKGLSWYPYGTVGTAYFADYQDALDFIDGYENGTIDDVPTEEYYSSVTTELYMTGKTRNPLKKSYTSLNLPYGQYDVRVTRITEDATDLQISDGLTFALIDEVNTADINYGGVALLGIKMKATDQLSSEPNFKIRVERRDILQGGTRKETTSPAVIVRDMLTNLHYGAGLSDDRLDLTSYFDWRRFTESNLDRNDVTLTFSDLLDNTLYYTIKPSDEALKYIEEVEFKIKGSSIPENIKGKDAFSSMVANFVLTENDYSKVAMYRDEVTNIRYEYNTSSLEYDLVMRIAFNRATVDFIKIELTNFSATLPNETYYNTNKLQFNGVLDTQSNLWDSLQRVSKVGRGSVIIKGTTYSCVVDKPTEATQLFNDSNILDDSFSVNYVGVEDVASEVEIQFADDVLNGEMNQVSVVDNSFYNSQLKPNKTTVQLAGATSKEEALIHGRYLLANNKFIKRTVNFKASIDSIACTVGDVIGISNSIPQWGEGGRITAVNGSLITLDQEVSIVSGTNYLIRGRYSTDETFVNFSVLNTVEETTNIIDVGVNSFAIDDIYTFGVDTGSDDDILFARVVDISRSNEQDRTISAVEYNESILDFDYDNDLVSQVAQLPKPRVILSNLSKREHLVKLSDGTIITRVTMNWESNATEATTYTAYYKKQLSPSYVDGLLVTPISEFIKLGTTEITSYVFDVTEVISDGGDSFQFLVAEEDKSNKYTTATFTVYGEALNPAPITGITSNSSNGTLTITWDKSIDVDFAKYRIVVDGVTHETTLNSIQIIDLDIGSYSVTVATIDRGNRTGVPAPHTATVSEPSLSYSIKDTYLLEKAFLDGIMIIYFGLTADKTGATAYDLWKVELGDLTVDEFSFHSAQLDGLSWDDFGTTHTFRYLGSDDNWRLCNAEQLLVIQRMMGYVTSNAITDGNVRVYSKEPFTPYSIGDLWIDGTDVKTCSVERLTGAYNVADWGGVVGEKVSLAPNVSLITTTPETQNQKGITITNEGIGYSDGTQLSSYIKPDGSFKFYGDNNNYIEWNGSVLTLVGSMTIQNPDTAGITASDVDAAPDSIMFDATTINGASISTGTVTADKIQAASISTGQLSASLSITTSGSGFFTGNVHGAFITASNGLTSSRTDTTPALKGTNSGGGHACELANNSTTFAAIEANNNGGSGATGVFGIGDYAVVGDNGGSYGFWTAGNAHFGGTVTPFTGSHIALVKTEPIIGDIITITDAIGLEINNSLPYAITTAIHKDKRVMGVYNGTNYDFYKFAIRSAALSTEFEDTTDIVEYHLDGTIVYNKYRIILPEWEAVVNDIIASEYFIAEVNAVGEGMINVCNEGGDIEAGDYICSSNNIGKGMKQDDDLLHNYTVAKALENVTWANEASNIKMISCTYHCG